MLTRVERQALRDRLAPVEVKWKSYGRDAWEGRFEHSGDFVCWLWIEHRVPLGWWWGAYVAESIAAGHCGHYSVIGHAKSSLPTLAAAQSAASSWLTSHLHPDREAILSLLDWADEVDAPTEAATSIPFPPGLTGETVEIEGDLVATPTPEAETLQAIQEWFEAMLMKTRPWMSWDVGTDGPYPPHRPFAIGVETPAVGYDTIRDGARLLGIEAPEWGAAYAWAKARLEQWKEATRPQALEWARVREAEEESP